MSAWRREAIAALPEARALIEQADRPMTLWIELADLFDAGVAAGNVDQARRLLDYAAWCFGEGSGKVPNDTSTAVVCAFYEHLATNRQYWPRFGRWFPASLFRNLRPIFGYFLIEEELAELVACYEGQSID